MLPAVQLCCWASAIAASACPTLLAACFVLPVQACAVELYLDKVRDLTAGFQGAYAIPKGGPFMKPPNGNDKQDPAPDLAQEVGSSMLQTPAQERRRAQGAKTPLPTGQAHGRAAAGPLATPAGLAPSRPREVAHRTPAQPRGEILPEVPGATKSDIKYEERGLPYVQGFRVVKLGSKDEALALLQHAMRLQCGRCVAVALCHTSSERGAPCCWNRVHHAPHRRVAH